MVGLFISDSLDTTRTEIKERFLEMGQDVALRI
jgi:hypothetical protein